MNHLTVPSNTSFEQTLQSIRVKPIPPYSTEWKVVRPHDSLTISKCDEQSRIFEAFSGLETSPIIVFEAHPLSVVERLKWAFDYNQSEEMGRCFSEFLLNPFSFFEQKGRYFLKGFSFTECPCFYYGRSVNPIRSEIEKIIVDRIDEEIKNKSEILRLASLGSGGLLQDLIILGKLWQKGFSSVRIKFCDLYDRDYDNAKEFEQFLNKLPHFSVKAKYTDEFKKKNKFHAIFSVDFNNLYFFNGSGWKSVFNAQAALDSNGYFFLFGDRDRLILKKNGLEDLSGRFNQLNKSVFEHNQELPPSHLKNQSSIRIVVTKEEGAGNFDCPSIALISQRFFSQYKKPVQLSLYGNERPGSSYYRCLERTSNEMVIKHLSGLKDYINCQYFNEGVNEEEKKRLLAITHIFIKELKSGDHPIVEFGMQYACKEITL